jgi:hypothetical protein
MNYVLAVLGGWLLVNLIWIAPLVIVWWEG